MTAIQTIYLNQTEYRVPPVIHAVQNDTGRKVKMVIQDQVLPSGSTATLDFMRSDKSHYSVTCEAFVSADNSFTAEIDQALTQAGPTECQLKVSGIVSTFTFIIDVQLDVSGISVRQDGYSAEQIIEIMGTKGITEDIKQTLLACFEKVAWIDDQGQDYYDALHDALYPPRPILSITATYIQSGTVYAGDSLDVLRPDLSVQVNYEDGGTEFVNDYYLSGSLSEGESTITVTYGGKTTTFDVQVVTLVSISAVYTQSGTVYDTDSLDSLRDDLVVTATYDDSSTREVTDYTLSGTLTEGTSTITVSYGGKTTAFTVTVTFDQETIFGEFINGHAVSKASGSAQSDIPRYGIWVSAASARAAFSTPIVNNGYTITVTDSSKYNVVVYDVQNNTQVPTQYSAAIEHVYYAGGTKTISWKSSDSATTPYILISLKKMDNTEFTDAELAHGAEAVFTFTTSS